MEYGVLIIICASIAANLWDDLHFDHVIPELYLKDIEKLKQILDDFGIPNDFDLNELNNLVPAHSRCNIRKSAELFVKVTTLYFLGLINAKITKVESV